MWLEVDSRPNVVGDPVLGDVSEPRPIGPPRPVRAPSQDGDVIPLSRSSVIPWATWRVVSPVRLEISRALIHPRRPSK